MPARRRRLPTELTGRAFTRAVALDCKVTPNMLRGPSVQRLVPGVYVDASVEPIETHRGFGYSIKNPRRIS